MLTDEQRAALEQAVAEELNQRPVFPQSARAVVHSFGFLHAYMSGPQLRSVCRHLLQQDAAHRAALRAAVEGERAAIQTECRRLEAHHDCKSSKAPDEETGCYHSGISSGVVMIDDFIRLRRMDTTTAAQRQGEA